MMTFSRAVGSHMVKIVAVQNETTNGSKPMKSVASTDFSEWQQSPNQRQSASKPDRQVWDQKAAIALLNVIRPFRARSCPTVFPVTATQVCIMNGYYPAVQFSCPGPDPNTYPPIEVMSSKNVLTGIFLYIHYAT